MGEPPQAELDEARLVELFDRLERPLYNVVYRWLWNPADAAEVVQEAFLRLWRMRRRVDVERVEALVYRIAVNEAASRRRRAKVRRWISLDSLQPQPADDASAEEKLLRSGIRAKVRRAIDSLPESLRRVVVLCEMSDLTQAQIGELLGIPSGTVGSRRHRALALLRRELREDDERD